VYSSHNLNGNKNGTNVGNLIFAERPMFSFTKTIKNVKILSSQPLLSWKQLLSEFPGIDQ